MTPKRRPPPHLHANLVDATAVLESARAQFQQALKDLAAHIEAVNGYLLGREPWDNIPLTLAACQASINLVSFTLSLYNPHQPPEATENP